MTSVNRGHPDRGKAVKHDLANAAMLEWLIWL